MKWNCRGGLAIFVLTAFVVTSFSEYSYAQARAQRGSGTLDSGATVGQTSVSTGGRLYREGLSSRAGGGVAPGNYVDPNVSRFGSAPVGRFQAPSLQTFRPRQVGVYDSFANPLDFSLAARPQPFVRDYTGRHTWRRAQSAQFGTGYVPGAPYMALQAPRVLLHENAFLAPVRRGTRGGRIRDALTNDTLRNMPDLIEQRLHPTAPQRSFAEMMEARLAAEYRKRLEDGWTYFSQGRYQEASSCFQSASTQRGNEVEATLGLMFCHAASGQYQTAMAIADRLLADQTRRVSSLPGVAEESPPNVFQCDVDLRSLVTVPAQTPDVESGEYQVPAIEPWSNEKLDSILRSLAIASDTSAAAPTAGVRVLTLWYAGERDEALRLADRIHRANRGSPLARMALEIRAAMENETQDPQVSASSPQSAIDR
ncbi:MAG: tetratricopeptide repeat protein [Phycisphaerales bacterium]|nr:MAG: tetratricopeptide repeat protein [Phycisphaerales bacterium]